MTYSDAFVEWSDEEEGFAILLVPSTYDGSEAVELGQPSSYLAIERPETMSEEDRLFFAAFRDCARDFDHQDVNGPVTFPSKAAANRVLAAVKRELKNIAKGGPAPTKEQIAWSAQIARIFSNKRSRR